jgi:plastocyanin domain-containing protein
VNLLRGATPGPRQVRVTITGTGFEPKEIHADAGDSVTLFITRSTEATCGKEVNFFGRGIQVAVPLDQETKITIDVNEPGVVRFGCLSGSAGATIRVAENLRP